MTARPLVIHDYFAIRGGGERTVLTLAAALGAGLMYGYRTSDTFEETMFPEERHDLALPGFLRARGLRVLALAAAFARARRAIAGYPLRFFSGAVAPIGAPLERKGGRNIYYCHTPPRFLYDLRELLESRMSPASRMAARVVLPSFQRRYEQAVGRMDLIVANSRNVQQRISRYLGRDSVVIYPPSDTSIRWRGQQGYYLSTARLTGIKRVDRIVDAFLRMPDRNLVVASGGELEGSLRAQAGNAPNIRFTGWIDEATLRQLIGDAIATIYVPVDEDFGMSPVESMAAGKPCIGVAEGGALETLIHGSTGVLLKPDFSIDDLVGAVVAMTPQRALSMRSDCEARAQLFSRQTFIDRMREIATG